MLSKLSIPTSTDEMKRLLIFLLHLSHVLVSCDEAVFCFKATENSTCCDSKCDQCQTFQAYLESVNSTISAPNLTMIFLTGIHVINRSEVTFTTSFLKMLGESNAEIVCSNGASCDFDFTGNGDWEIENLTLLKILLFFGLSNASEGKGVGLHRLSITSVILDQGGVVAVFDSHVDIMNVGLLSSQCIFMFVEDAVISDSDFHSSSIEFWHVSKTKMNNCVLIQSKILLRSSTLTFTGFNNLTRSHAQSVVTSFLSSIIFSGEVLFAHNFGVSGGALYLYSSNLKVLPDSRVSFINNTASYKGGAIYIEPGLSIIDRRNDIVPSEWDKDDLPYCFYCLLNCDETSVYTFEFVNNSAVQGGNDIYGTSLELSGKICRYTDSEVDNCRLNVSRNFSSFSSVSSDPLRVCLCNKIGHPECNIIHSSQNVCPGEEMAIPAIVMGGDFGATIGMVFAFTKPSDSFDPVLSPSSHASQSITNVESCGTLSYRFYTNLTGNVKLYLTTSYVSSVSDESNCLMDPYCLHTTPVYINVYMFMSIHPHVTAIQH